MLKHDSKFFVEPKLFSYTYQKVIPLTRKFEALCSNNCIDCNVYKLHGKNTSIFYLWTYVHMLFIVQKFHKSLEKCIQQVV